MRTLSLALLSAVVLSAAATAQTAPPAPAGAPPAAAAPSPAPSETAAPRSGRHARNADISREEYVERAVERARRAAETRFDRMDTDHDGILTAAERRAARAARHGGTTQ